MTVLGAKGRNVQALLIDLDDTLYRSESSEGEASIPRTVRVAIERFMVQHLGYTEHDVASSCNALYLQHGTTMAGLVSKGHKVDFDHWHKSVHYGVLDYDALLHPDPKLRDLLNAIPLPKWILTNADHTHAQRCLARMGIADCFQGIFDFEWAQAAAEAQGLLTHEHPIMCKPQHHIYTMALESLHLEPSQVVFFDDSARNIQAAHELGLVTAVVGRDTPVPGADFVLPTMHMLPAVMPELLLPKSSVAAAKQVPQQQAHVEHAMVDDELVPAHLVVVAQGSGSMQ